MDTAADAGLPILPCSDESLGRAAVALEDGRLPRESEPVEQPFDRAFRVRSELLVGNELIVRRADSIQGMFKISVPPRDTSLEVVRSLPLPRCPVREATTSSPSRMTWMKCGRRPGLALSSKGMKRRCHGVFSIQLMAPLFSAISSKTRTSCRATGRVWNGRRGRTPRAHRSLSANHSAAEGGSSPFSARNSYSRERGSLVKIGK